LRRLLVVSRERYAVMRRFLPGRASSCGTYDRAIIAAAVAAEAA